MNFNFINPGSSLNQLMNGAGFKEGDLDLDIQGEGGFFARKLGALLDSREVGRNLAASGQISLKEVLAALSGEAESAGNAGMLDLLKKILNLPGMDKAVISPEGLEDLEELLIKAGYSRTDVSDLFAGFAEDDESGDIPLKSILDALDESGIRPDDPDASEEDGANFLAVSYNPFIESILTALGIPEVEAGSIMALSQSQGRGIDLDILINKLQELQKQAFQSGRVYQADANDRSLAVFLDHAGVESGGEKNSLGDFLSFLEKMRFNGEQDGSLNYFSPETDSVSTSPAGDSTGLLNSFFKNIRIPDHGDAGVAGNGSVSIDRTDIEKGLAQFLKLFEGQPGVGQTEAFTENGDLEISSDLLRLVEQAGSQVRGEKMTEGSSPRGNQVTAALDRSERRVVGLEAGASAGTPFKEPDLTGDPEAVKNRPGPRTLPAYVANQVGKNLAQAISRGESELRLQLKPPELGRLIMTIDHMGSSIKVSVVTENHAAKEILASHAGELKSILTGSGISIESFDVEMGSDFQQSMAHARQQNSGGAGFGKGGRRNLSSGSAEGTSQSLVSPADDPYEMDGVLHFVA